MELQLRILKPAIQNIIVQDQQQMIRQNRLFFDDRINPEKLRTLFNQYVYVHPDKEVMKDYPSPDELDSLGSCFYGDTEGY